MRKNSRNSRNSRKSGGAIKREEVVKVPSINSNKGIGSIYTKINTIQKIINNMGVLMKQPTGNNIIPIPTTIELNGNNISSLPPRVAVEETRKEYPHPTGINTRGRTYYGPGRNNYYNLLGPNGSYIQYKKPKTTTLFESANPNAYKEEIAVEKIIEVPELYGDALNCKRKTKFGMPMTDNQVEYECLDGKRRPHSIFRRTQHRRKNNRRTRNRR